MEKWQQTAQARREVLLQAQHSRTRERLLVLYEIAQGQSATQVALRSNRDPQMVMEWVHRYNTNGLEALTYQHNADPPLV